MSTPNPLVFAVVAVVIAAAIGAVPLRPAPKPSGEPAAAASADEDRELARAMTFAEPKT